MVSCFGAGKTCFCDQLEIKGKETPKGFQVDVTAKDPAKTKSLKALMKAVHDFCGCEGGR